MAARHCRQRSTARIVTGKLTYKLSPRQTLVGYLQHQEFTNSSYFIVGATQPFQTSDALPRMTFPASVWKGEYNAALTDAVYLEARAGGYFSNAANEFKSAAPRISDVGANTVTGGALANERSLRRPQVNGSMSFLKSGRGGSHTVRIGGEYMFDSVESPTVRVREPVQLRLDSQQRRAHPGADPPRVERVEERHGDVCRCSWTIPGASIGESRYRLACAWIATSQAFRNKRDRPARSVRRD